MSILAAQAAGARWLASVCLWLWVTGGWALINPDFTPIHLVRQSEQIAELELLEARTGAFTGRVTRAFKGAPGPLIAILDTPRLLGKGRALLFVGTAELAYLHTGTQWYRLTRAAQGPWRVEARADQLQKTWDGGTLMLARCVEYILTTAEPTVPALTTERWTTPVNLTTNLPVAGLRVEADFDGDGLLDVLEPGQLRWNRGDGIFTNVWAESGEAVAALRSNVIGLAVGDINLDSRADFVVFYGDAPPQLFFNRGFRTFGLSASLQLTNAVGNGVLADLNDDGVPDLALRQADGTMLAFHCQREGKRPLLLGARAEVAAIVTAWHGQRCLGAWRASPGMLLSWAVPGPGLYRLEWGVGRRREVKLLDRPVTVVLGAD